MEPINAVFIHGFLGLPTDGDELFKNLSLQETPVSWQSPDLWKDVSPREFTSLARAGERLASVVTGERLHIFAYSLGGRITLHWPEAQWGRIASLTLLSVHAGLLLNNEREVRAEQDVMWSQKFLQEPWDGLCQQWNQQEVFRGDLGRPNRNEKDFSREELAQALCGWSLSEQEYPLTKLQQYPFPVTYWSGERDGKFSSYALILREQLPHWHFHQAQGKGHSLYANAAREIVREWRLSHSA